MPVQRGTDRKGGFYRYGKSGKKYRYSSESGRKKAKAKASMQGRAIKSKDAKKTPAKPSERVKGSKKNKPGSAAGKSGKIELSEKTTETLKKKVEGHKGKATLGQLKAVYRRGAGAFSSSHHPNANRHSWAMGRVNSFLKRGHSQDDDLR
jgi:hypothetical protein